MMCDSQNWNPTLSRIGFLFKVAPVGPDLNWDQGAGDELSPSLLIPQRKLATI